MITLKTREEISLLRQGGKILANVLATLNEAVKPGISTWELDVMAEKLIREQGGAPSFKNYRSSTADSPFPTTICASVNDELVHAPASEKRILKDGDILSIDIGMKYPNTSRGLFTDMATTVAVGEIDSRTKKLLQVTKECLDRAIAEVKSGNKIEDLARAVESHAESHGYSVVRSLIGHGVGYAVHEDPHIPNYTGSKDGRIVLKEGMVLAIEPMVNEGRPDVDVGADGWSIATRDGRLCAHFEHTVAVTNKGCLIITAL